MAKFEKTFQQDFDHLLCRVDSAVMNGSSTASLEEESSFRSGSARCAVRVYERYSAFGGNRVSMSVTLFQNAEGPVYLSAITAGGSQAMLFKVNTFGEESFLDTLRYGLED